MGRKLFPWLAPRFRISYISFFLFYSFFLFFSDRVPLYSPSCLGTHSVCRPGWPQTQKFSCICLPSAGITGMCHHCLAFIIVLHSGFFLCVCMCVCVVVVVVVWDKISLFNSLGCLGTSSIDQADLKLTEISSPNSAIIGQVLPSWTLLVRSSLSKDGGHGRISLSFKVDLCRPEKMAHWL